VLLFHQASRVSEGGEKMGWVIGDKVQLKSGGPIMTVVRVSRVVTEDDPIQVAWFDVDGNPRRDQYPAEALEAPPTPRPDLWVGV